MEICVLKGPDPRRSPLDDPACARQAWAHYRRMMRWAGELALGLIGIVWVILWHEFALISIHLYIASALGIGFTVMMTAALMGLVFVSHSSGHDDAIGDPLEDETWL